MKVKELIEILKLQDQELPVVYSKWSEYIIFDGSSIEEANLQPARPDGWVHYARDDKQTVRYLVLT